MARQWKPNKLRERADGAIGGRFAGRSLLSQTQPELGVGRVLKRPGIKRPAAATLIKREERAAQFAAQALTDRMF